MVILQKNFSFQRIKIPHLSKELIEHLSFPGGGGEGSPRSTGSPLLDGLDALLQRISSERFAELRNIQLTDRPVTGGQARGKRFLNYLLLVRRLKSTKLIY